VHPDDVAFMVDGDLETRWHTGPQAPDNEVVVDLGTRAAWISSSCSLAGSRRTSRGASRSTCPPTARSGRRSGRAGRPPTRCGPPSKTRARCRCALTAEAPKARYIRMRQTGEDPVYYWSIAELVVYGW
jgi:hypothetical protein